MLCSFPQYFSSFNVARSYSKHEGSYILAAPVRDLDMFDFSHSPSIMNFLELLEEDKSSTEIGTDHHNMLEKWMCMISFATGVSIPKIPISYSTDIYNPDYFPKNEEQFIDDQKKYTKKDAQYEKLAKRLSHMGLEGELPGLQRGVSWDPKNNVDIKEYQMEKRYSFGTNQEALLRSSVLDIDYMVVEALKHTFPKMDGYAAGYTPTRSITGGDMFFPEMCVFYPSVVMKYEYGRRRQNTLISGGNNNAYGFASKQQLMIGNAQNDESVKKAKIMQQKLEVTFEQYLSLMKLMYCKDLVDIDEVNNDIILGGGSKKSKTSPASKRIAKITTPVKNNTIKNNNEKRKNHRSKNK